jgi:magnesium-transporting ATPase (P-type)
VELRVGDRILADARLLNLKSSSLLLVDEASLTGECVTANKLPGDKGTNVVETGYDAPLLQDQRGMLFSGTMITSGSGQALVVQTGMDTQFGKISAGVTQVKQVKTKTPLAIKLDAIGGTYCTIVNYNVHIGTNPIEANPSTPLTSRILFLL